MLTFHLKICTWAQNWMTDWSTTPWVSTGCFCNNWPFLGMLSLFDCILIYWLGFSYPGSNLDCGLICGMFIRIYLIFYFDFTPMTISLVWEVEKLVSITLWNRICYLPRCVDEKSNIQSSTELYYWWKKYILHAWNIFLYLVTTSLK